MSLALNFVFVVASIFALWFGALWFVEAATRIARRTGLSELVIGLTVVAFGTSAPELFVSVQAAFAGKSDIAVGNVVGSNIFNLGIILGGVALTQSIATSRGLVWRDGLMLIGSSGLLVLFLADHSLSRIEGIIFLTMLISYLTYLIVKRQPSEEELPEGDFTPMDIVRFAAGLLLIIVGANLLVSSASEIARFFGVSDWIIGVTIVAAGTSAPELVTSLVAAMRGKFGISAGNLIGSDLFNILGVLGVSSILQPLSVVPAAQMSVYFLLGMMIIVVIMMRSGWRLSRLEGGFLVIIGIARWAFDFLT